MTAEAAVAKHSAFGEKRSALTLQVKPVKSARCVATNLVDVLVSVVVPDPFCSSLPSTGVILPLFEFLITTFNALTVYNVLLSFFFCI